MTPRVQKAIDIFLDALNNYTLNAGSCSACAVGNLVAAGRNLKYKDVYGSKTVESPLYWHNKFLTANGIQRGLFCSAQYYIDLADADIASTDFSEDELKQIEFTFETNSCHYEGLTKEAIRKNQIKALTAVVNVMLTFDDCKIEESKQFVEKAELVPLHA